MSMLKTMAVAVLLSTAVESGTRVSAGRNDDGFSPQKMRNLGMGNRAGKLGHILKSSKSSKKKKSEEPSAVPSAAPSSHPSVAPSDDPSSSPSAPPSDVPSDEPSLEPSDVPSDIPSDEPSLEPSDVPSDVPSDEPSSYPTKNPTSSPTHNPTSVPTKNPTSVPTKNPTSSPTHNPTPGATAFSVVGKIRIRATQLNNNQGIWDVVQIYFYATACSGSYSTTGFAIGSGNYNGAPGYGPDSAFDSNPNTIWGGRAGSDGTTWIGRDYGTLTPVSCVRFVERGNGNPPRIVTEFIIESWDGMGWQPLGGMSPQTKPVTQTITIVQPPF